MHGAARYPRPRARARRYAQAISWTGLAFLLAVAAAIAIALRAPLRLSLFAACMLGYVSLAVVMRYDDDGPNAWYIGFAFWVFLADLLLIAALLIAAASRAAKRRQEQRGPVP